MGKKKFDSKKGVTFKLIYKSSDDQDSSADKTLSERIFSVIEQQKKTAVQENDKERQKILSQFTKEELGQAAPKRKKDPNAVNNVEHGAAISTHAKGRDDLWITHLMRMKEAAKAQLDQEEEEEEEEEERKRIEKTKKQALLEKLREKAFKKTAASQLKKAKETEGKDGEEGEDEGWESCEDEGDDDDEEEEIEDVEEWEEEEEEEEYEEIEVDEEDLKEMQKQQQQAEEEEEEPIKLTKAKGPVDEIKKGGKTVFEEIQHTKAPQVHFEDFPTLGTGEVMEFVHENVDIPMPPKPEEKTAEQKVEEKAEEEIDLKRTIVQGEVKMQRFDEMGLPIDGYNYYQHVVDANSGGQPQFAFTVTYDHVVNLPEDNDFRLEKMNVEERELYEALEHENVDGAYEELDDDFFGQITKESGVKLEDGYYDPRQKKETKKVTFAEGEVTEISTVKEEVGKKGKEEGQKEVKGKGGKDSVLSRQDFNKVLDEHVALLKNRFRNERERNKARYGIESSDEDEDVEEVEDFSDDEEEEDDGVREHVDQIPFEKDVAMQQVMKRDEEADSEEDEDSDEEFYDERKSTKSNRTGQATLADTEIFSLARKAKLNIIKEKRGEEKEREKEAKKEEEEEDSEDEEEDGKGKVEEVFKKRERGETKEERKQRKEAVKQFKQERKEKKKKFKENFDSKKKEHLKINQRQATSLQGTTIYKLTV